MKRRDFLKGSVAASAALPLFSWSNNEILPNVEVPPTIRVNIPGQIETTPAPRVWVDGKVIPYVQDLQIRCERNTTLQQDLSDYRHSKFRYTQNYVDMTLLSVEENHTWWNGVMMSLVEHRIKLDWYAGIYTFDGILWSTPVITPLSHKHTTLELTWAATNGIQFEEHDQ